MPEKEFYRKKAKEVLDELGTSRKGLSQSEAQKRLERDGKNVLQATAKKSLTKIFLLQFKDVLVILLLVAAVMSFAIGSYRDGTIMVIIAVINSVIGFRQEYKAEKIMDSLNKLVKSPSKVIRDDQIGEISQEELVVGDIISLEEGDKIPADLRIIESFNLRTNDVSLTGESMPQEKQSNHIEAERTLADRDNMAYLGTTVASGSAKGVVVRTGMDTEMGKIASMTQEEDKSKSPLQSELQSVANKIAVFAVVIALALFGISIYQGYGLDFALIYALGIAVAVVPQALPMQVTVALSQGVDRLAGKNAVVKKLSSAETLGSTNVVCTDKTGTLTKNEMTVKKVYFDGKEYEVTGLGYQPEGELLGEDGEPLTEEEIAEMEIIFDAATMASNAEIHEPDDEHPGWYAIGDPTEAALITLSTKLGTRSPTEDEDNPELHEFSFDSDRKRMSSIREFEDGNYLKMKGALGSVLSVSKHILKDGEVVEITEADKERLNKLNEKYSKDAMRVLAIAYRKLEDEETDYVLEEIEKDVIFLGLVAMIDPPKEGVRDAIQESHAAHIDTYMMTGDHAITAQAVGKEIKLSIDDEDVPVFTSEDLNSMSEKELREIMEENESLIFSRVSPENKLRIVKNLKEQQKIVAVTGDGVNDAPALKSAHIGVAMGQMGTDVSKEASELILLDDSFPTLVYAIKEGRNIYNNLKKTVIASLTTNGAELTIVLLGLLAAAVLGTPIPILAIQILSIDLIAEILPLTALTFDPASEHLMKSPPRKQEDHIVNKHSFSEILFLALLMGGLAFTNFYLFINGQAEAVREGTQLYARGTTISFLTIAFSQWVNIMSRRYEYKSIFNKNFFSNTKMLYSILISIVMVLLVIYSPINSFLGFAGVTLADWGRIILAGGIFLLGHEGIKFFKRKNETV
ncbi:Ca2+-transporting ATPase [Halanaerobium saccharolyticum]|uniref:Ca2+-transporting ATPase n=1 Tax=Halanaerobium saccharolyticum TaxID=43595 RepID=A0A4R7Z6Y6_9FIRM|nr:cation-transporting P-type ATPase [Halanaerobium saccharolyticum]RAK10560.1 Ca2+-transporting ATPase [Halanaerobium saccharolyticum]TDW06683.1 Ca2+-transporting ATPase [Halanaerobium saccharolyticum]TDX62318.1 Ca2+-transporting ATPase [Halanaerobium saccharolyticum]